MILLDPNPFFLVGLSVKNGSISELESENWFTSELAISDEDVFMFISEALSSKKDGICRLRFAGGIVIFEEEAVSKWVEEGDLIADLDGFCGGFDGLGLLESPLDDRLDDCDCNEGECDGGRT